MKFSFVKSLFSIGFIFSLLIIGIRQMGGLETFELLAFDQMLRLQIKPSENINQYIVIVGINEGDIRTQKEWPLPDSIIIKALKTLNRHKPVAIGLDLFRDLPKDPDHNELIQELQKSNMISICKVGITENSGISPPEGIDPQQLGFADIMVDPGGIVRRGLIFTQPPTISPCQAQLSLAFQLAQKYLEQQNLQPELTEDQELKWNNTLFKPLSPHSGGYSNIDNRGYQILLNYKLIQNPPRYLSLNDLLNNRFESEWIKNKIVLIGVTAQSIDDAFYTPYSASAKSNQKIPGVLIHAQLINQIITTTLGENHLFWYCSQWLENLLILISGLLASVIIHYIRRPLSLILVTIGGFTLLNWGYFFLFIQGGWFPVIPANLSLFGSLIISLIYRNYQSQQEKERISAQVKQQSQDIALLRALLKNVPSPSNLSGLTNSPTFQVKSESEITTTLFTGIQKENTGFNKLLVGRYNLLKILGSGGFGYAYLAEDIQRPGNPQCVVKQLQPGSTDEAFLQVARRLFCTEASILEKLGDHPQIPQLLAHFEENDQFYLVEEYIQGMILAQEIQENKPLSEKEVILILKEILSILSYIHSQGVIHRDIKPSNIIRRQKDQHLVLIDFGAVKEIQPSHQYAQDEHTIAIGTKGYTPVEQLAGQPYFNSDIYALGMIIIYALTGISPEKLPRNEHNGEIEWHHLVDNINPNLMMILDQMVRYHFKDRIKSADLILKDLNQF